MRPDHMNFCCLCAAILSSTAVLFGQDPLGETALLTKNPNHVVCTFFEDCTMESLFPALCAHASQDDPLYVLGNSYCWFVSKLHITDPKEALFKEKGDLSIQNFRFLSFTDCSSKESSPSIIHQKNGQLFLRNNGSMSFCRNHAEGSGGAISADAFSLQHNYLFTAFEENSSKGNGGAFRLKPSLYLEMCRLFLSPVIVRI